jgi:ABC-type transport system substrate-binding protein
METGRHRFIQMSGLAAAAFGVAACTSSKTTTVAGKAKPGGQFAIALEEEPATLLQVAPISSTSTTRVERMIQSVLLEVGPDFQPLPQLADQWSISPDGLTYTFNLNPNAKWSDGKPVTAADVEFTFALLTKLNANGQMGRFSSAHAIGLPGQQPPPGAGSRRAAVAGSLAAHRGGRRRACRRARLPLRRAAGSVPPAGYTDR